MSFPAVEGWELNQIHAHVELTPYYNTQMIGIILKCYTHMVEAYWKVFPQLSWFLQGDSLL